MHPQQHMPQNPVTLRQSLFTSLMVCSSLVQGLVELVALQRSRFAAWREKF